MEYMKTVPDKYFELAIVDPPYGILKKPGNVIKNKSDTDHLKNISWDMKKINRAYFDDLIRVSINQIIWGGNYFLDYLGYCKAPIIWDKLNGKSLYADGEMAWTSRGFSGNLKIFKHQWCGAFKDSERRIKSFHPTQKPIDLYKWILKNYAKPGDKILDTHVGSASSLIACEDMGFEYVGCELDAEYYKMASERIENFKLQGKLF